MKTNNTPRILILTKAGNGKNGLNEIKREFIKLKRPKLKSYSLSLTIKSIQNGNPGIYITVSPGQWDIFLEEAYFRQGAVLIELDENENPISAYKYDY